MGRYDRQLPLFGTDGQSRIKGSRVAVVGCGGLGCNVATQLALACMGGLTLIDDDMPSETDFNRQFPHILNPGMMKCDSLEHWISLISDTACTPVGERFTADNSGDLLKGCDIAVDCLDNNEARLELNRACMQMGIPLVHGAVDGFLIQTMTCVGKPCLECFLRPGPPYDGPSLGAAVSVLAGLQATETLRIASGADPSHLGRLISIDLSSGSFASIPITGADGCPVCGTLPDGL